MTVAAAHVYHLAEAGNWPAIARDGLKPAAQLLHEAAVDAALRQALNTTQRGGHTRLPGGAEIRDQAPMPARALATCLVGMTPAQWYAWINDHVFFWFDIERLNRQRRACEPRPQVVLTFDLRRLAAAHAGSLALTPINSGNARRRPAPRSQASFVPWTQWCEEGWVSEAMALGTRPRPRRHAPVELAHRGALPDAMAFVIDTRPLAPGQSFSA